MSCEAVSIMGENGRFMLGATCLGWSRFLWIRRHLDVSQSVERFLSTKTRRWQVLKWLPFFCSQSSSHCVSSFSHDTTHLEVAAYLDADASVGERLHVLFAGDGLVEWIVLPFICSLNGQGSSSWTVKAFAVSVLWHCAPFFDMCR